MTPQEQQLLADLFGRVRGTANAPRDRDAEAFIADAIRAMPFAPYVLAQTVLVQEEGLRAATERVRQLEAQVGDLQAQGASAPAATSFLGGLGKSMFGATPSAPAAPAQPSGPWGRMAAPPPQPSPGWGASPQPQPAPWQQPMGSAPAGGGFLKGALGAAAGVAGGVLLADSIRNMMGGHGTPFGAFGGGAFGGVPGGGETVVNNYYDGSPHDGGLSQSQIADMDHTQDQLQDAADNSDTSGGSDFAGSDFGGGGGDTSDV